MEVFQNSQKFLCRYANVVSVPLPAPGCFYEDIPVPRVLCHERTELTEVPGTSNTTGMVLYVPYRTQLCCFFLFFFLAKVRKQEGEEEQQEEDAVGGVFEKYT